MNQAGLLRSGIRVVAAVLILLGLAAPAPTRANGESTDNRFVPVAYDGLVRYMLDTATVKHHRGLSGQSLVDVWIEGRLDAGTGSRVQAFLGGYPPGVDYTQVALIRARYLFWIASSVPQPEAKAAVIERQYFDIDSRIIRRDPFAPPANTSEWRSLNETEEKALQSVMLESSFQVAHGFNKELRNLAAAKELDEGFLGRPWGSRPADFKGAWHIADIAPKVMVYGADLDLSPILGSVSAHTAPRLVFAEDGRLVKARVTFDPRDYGRVYQHLVRVLGEPAPIIYELWAARVDFDERSEWLVGRDTKVVLTSWLSGAIIEIGRRDSLLLEGRKFEKMVAAAQLRQAQEYERQNRIPEASSIYQELLNGSDSAHLYTATAQERLAACSGRSDAVEFLGKDGGFTFSRLRNVYPESFRQFWLRIDLDNEARAELQKHRPGTIGPQDMLADIAAVLCRVQAVPAAGKYVVSEQVWLDSANRIIGSRPAWAPQDTVWPAPYIRQACEDFLEAWFTLGGMSGTGPKKASE